MVGISKGIRSRDFLELYLWWTIVGIMWILQFLLKPRIFPSITSVPCLTSSSCNCWGWTTLYFISSIWLKDTQFPQKFSLLASSPRDPIISCHSRQVDNGVYLEHMIHTYGVSGGSVINFCRQFFSALESALSKQVNWPSHAEQVNISAEFDKHRFPGCVGLIDS